MRDRPAAPVSLTGLYLGVFIGPLMGGVTNVMLPVLRDDFAATLGQVTAIVSAYMVPFVLLQLVSGTIADRFSRGGTVTGGCAAFAASLSAGRRRAKHRAVSCRSRSSGRCQRLRHAGHHGHAG